MIRRKRQHCAFNGSAGCVKGRGFLSGLLRHRQEGGGQDDQPGEQGDLGEQERAAHQAQ